MKICVMTMCYNEIEILPFWLDYYVNFIKVDKIIFYDGGSIDGSKELIKSCPIAEIIEQYHDKTDTRWGIDVQNNGWKKYKNDFDWMIVCDVDEFLYHPNLKEKLEEYKEQNITIPLIEGFDMISENFPTYQKGKYIPEQINKGIKDSTFLNKKIIFNPKEVEINYHMGCHGCEPTGKVKFSDNYDFKMLHYRWLSHEYLTNLTKKKFERLCNWNIENNMGIHYKTQSMITLDEYSSKYKSSIVVVNDFPKIEKKKIYLFSHNYLINDWKEILENQLNIIITTGLYKEMTSMYLMAYGDEWKNLIKLVRLYDIDDKIITLNIDDNFYEYPTIQKLYKFVKNIDNSYILYFHLKGVWSINNSGRNPEAIRSWRKCLEYFNIEKWEDCISKLNEGFEVVGALYNYNEKEPLFSGNFWWTTSDYIKKLKYPDYDSSKDPYFGTPEDDKTWCRVNCEKWINTIPNKFYNFYTPKDYGLYFVPIDENDYKKPKISIIIPTYNRFNLLKEAIQSVFNQNYDNFEILICHDGYSDEYEKFILNFNHEKIFYDATEKKGNNYGTEQRNLILNKSTGDYVMYLDDDNILYDNYLNKMVEQIDSETGMVVCKIHFNDKEWYNYVLPLENELRPCFIDSLNVLIKSDIAKNNKWDNFDIGHDHRHINNCENEINEKRLKIKYIPDILASHRFFGTTTPKITIIHHCYLRYNWKSILEEQISLMKNSGLYDSCSEIFATIYADDKNNFIEFKNIISREDPLIKWKVIELEQNSYEYDTLKFIKKYCEDKHSYICYFHLKGVISEQIEPNIGVPTWREYLNYFTIEKWKDNVEKLKDNDVVCVDWNFNDMHQRYVLGGHFFWTKSEYIRTLSEPINNENRFLSEIWITSNENVKIYENFNYEKIGYKNLYLQIFPPSLYKDNVKNSVDDLVNLSFEKYGAQQNKWEYIEFLKRLIEKNKTGNILEIGSKYGGTTYGFCNIFNDVISIDIFKEEQITKIEKEFNNFTFILGDTHDEKTKHQLNGMKFDVIYIDGDHEYNAVKQDYLDYKEFVKDDGIIVFHDIKRTWWTDEVGIQVPILWEEIKNDYIYEEIINNENDCFGIGLLFKKEINNPVIIMTTHPNFKTSEEITKQSLKSLNPLNIDTILSTHCPISLNLQNAATHFIYDKNNPLIRHDYYDQSWFDTDEYYSLIKLHKNDNDLQHALAVYINYYNGILHAKSLGYTTAICTNFDIVFDNDDLNIITNKMNEMLNTGKKSFYMTSNPIEGIHYKTIFFITDIDFFLENFKYVTNETDYNKLTREVGAETNCLENFFYQTLKNSDKLLLQQIEEKDLFSKSKVNLFSNIEYFTVLPLRNDSNGFVIWFSSANSMDDNRDLTIKTLEGNDVIFLRNDKITKNYIFFKKIKFKRDRRYLINCKISYDGVIKEKNIIIENDESFDKLYENGEFWDKKGILE